MNSKITIYKPLRHLATLRFLGEILNELNSLMVKRKRLAVNPIEIKNNAVHIIFFALLINYSCGQKTQTIGLHDDFTSTEGWQEVDPNGDTIPPVVEMVTGHGTLTISHKFRTLEEAAEKWPWIESKEDTSTNLRKNYGEIDLDKYHYVVLNVKEKGSSSYFDINGFTTKLGFTTGLTVIDLNDYSDPRIEGKQIVDFGIDLQDNHTRLILDDLKFVSELSEKENKKLIGPGLTIRDENLNPRPYHGLKALKARENISLPVIDGEEMAIFRDDATGGVTTRLTATIGDDYFGEGGIWSADGSAVKFKSNRKSKGIPILIPGEARVIDGPEDAFWRMWSKTDGDVLYIMRRNKKQFSVYSWHKVKDKGELIAKFEVPEIGSYVEFKKFTPLGNIVVAFRETPHLYIIDIKNKKARYIELPTRLKDAGVSGEDNTVSWANCYTYELRWINLDTGESGLSPGFSAGHASHGPNGMVANFGGYLNVFVPGDIGKTFNPGNKISIWANWANRIVTDYGRVTVDNKYVFTNGRREDVDHQHLMIPSEDPGAVLRVARYFTEFSWTSTTYSRPSPDYTKLIYNENSIGSTELYMVYTRRPDPPVNAEMNAGLISWEAPERHLEIAGYNVYGSNQSGHGFVRLNDEPILETHTQVDGNCRYYAITSVEHSRLESMFSSEVSKEGSRSFYFEAEEMKLTPPARRFFDGYANGFQTVRINAESEAEISMTGKVSISVGKIPSGNYAVWARVKGEGSWSVNSEATSVRSDKWEWIRLSQVDLDESVKLLDLTSSDDALKLDMVLLTTESFIPKAPYPMDQIPPKSPMNVMGTMKGNHVNLIWTPTDTKDVHHYSVYAGDSRDFICSNETIIRSVLKNTVTDATPKMTGKLFYKIIAVDNRWNQSEPAIIQVN